MTSPVAMPLACQVAASVFLDLTIIRGGIEMEIELVTIGVQPVGIVSLKDGASRPPGFDEPGSICFADAQSRFLALIGFKAATEVYAIVEGPRFCINAYVEIWCGIKFCGKFLGIPIPCGIKWCRVSVEIAVRHPRTLHRAPTRPPQPTSRLVPRTVHDH